MLFNASNSPPVGRKRNLVTLSRVTHLSFLILCFLVLTNKAAVIKKRDTADTPLTHNGNTAANLPETEVAPTILTAVLNNASAISSTKLQSINSDQNFATESSKELANNEISIGEAKKDQSMKAKTETETENYQIKESSAAKSPDILQDNGLASNAIKEQQVPKLIEKEKELVSASPGDDKNSRSIENTLHPTVPSNILNDFKTETEEPVGILKVQSKQLDNNIENSKEYIQKELQLIKKESLEEPLEPTTPKTLASTGTWNSDEQVLKAKTNEIKKQELPLKSLEASTATETLPVSLKSQIKAPAFLTQVDREQKSNQIYDSELLQPAATTSEPLLALEETTLKPLTKEERPLLLYDDNKQDYARSLFREDVTTFSSKEHEEPLTTTLSAILSPKTEHMEGFNQENLKDPIEDLNRNDLAPTLSVKEKKPKFINDNSTNAQQLNLPNNAEAWSLASMKSLPKANITMETTQAYNNTHKELKVMQNTTLTGNNNSEKNLLDWSQIMMDKELSTTTRNEDGGLKKENKTNDMEAAVDTTTTVVQTNEDQQFQAASGIEVTTKNFLAEQEFTTNTIPTALTTTILSTLSYNENDNGNNHQLDKKIEENMNNHIDTIMATLATTTTVPATVDNNPFNTSLNIEPNLNKKINLTSNQTQIVLNNDVHTTAMKTAVNEEANAADTQMETSTVAAMATATTTATATATAKTKATAVIDMTTLEQIFSETTTVSIPETTKQNASLNNVAATEQEPQQQQQLQQNKTNNSVINEESNYSVSVSHNELENTLVDRRNSPNENIDLNTQRTTAIPSTTTVVPVTTFRPTILAITSTTSAPAAFQQEVDQIGNEIQTNLTKNEQQSIVKTVETHLTAREFETTTTTTTETPTSTAITPAPAESTTNKIENTLTSSWEHEPIATTSSSRDDGKLNLDTGEETTTTTTTQNTPKQVIEQQNKGDKETTTGSAVVLEDGKFEKESKTTTATTTTSETIYTVETTTPVVIATESGWAVIGSTTPATATTTTTAEQQNTTETTTAKQESDTKENALSKEDAQIGIITTTTAAAAAENMNKTQEITTSTSAMPATTAKEEETYISLLDDTTTRTTTTTSTAATLNATTPPSSSSSSSSTLPSAITTKVEEIYNVINSTTTEVIQTTTTATQQLLTEIEEEEEASSASTFTTTTSTEVLPTAAATTTTTQTSEIIATADIGGKTLPTLTSIMGGNSGNMYPKNPEASGDTDVNVIIAITVSVIGVIALVLLVGFLYLMRKRQKQTSYSQRCRPVSLDEYTIDNASVSGSMRKSSALRASKRTYGNLAFDDPALRPNPMGVQELAKFAQEKLRMFEEFRDVPQITSRLDEVPTGCEDKNRYANVLPLPETRVILQRLNDDEKSEYINANYVTGPKDPPNYYIACQAPLESTVEDFWRMIWEQQSRVIIQATDLIENGVEKCAEYLPPSVTLDNHSSFGDFQITLQNREVKDKYAISTILIKHVGENATRELTHYWYKWPEVGVPTEEAPIIAMLLEARSSLISYAIEQANEDKEKFSTGTLKANEEDTSASAATTPPINNSNGTTTANIAEINGNISMVHIKKSARNQGPLTVHCSPGTGRTGTIIACDVAIRSLETPKRIVDIPQIVYYVRRGRASAVLTKEQYEFIYKVASMYAAKITNPTNYN